MKLGHLIALIFSGLAGTAFCQPIVQYDATADINLASSSAVTIASASTTFVGNLSGIACTVTSALGGASNVYITAQFDTSTLTINLYSSASTAWHSDVLPYAHASNGANVGDSFFIPLSYGGYASSLTVTAHPAGGASGHLRCNALYLNR